MIFGPAMFGNMVVHEPFPVSEDCVGLFRFGLQHQADDGGVVSPGGQWQLLPGEKPGDPLSRLVQLHVPHGVGEGPRGGRQVGGRRDRLPQTSLAEDHDLADGPLCAENDFQVLPAEFQQRSGIDFSIILPAIRSGERQVQAEGPRPAPGGVGLQLGQDRRLAPHEGLGQFPRHGG